MTRLFILMTLSISCADVAPLCEDYPSTSFFNVDGYDVNATERSGLNIDAPVDFDTDYLADVIDDIDECLANIGTLSFEEAEKAWCPHQEWHYQPMRLECIEIKITDDWHWSSNKEYQMLWTTADRVWCVKKGFDAKHECFWRAAIQNGFQIIVPPKPRLIGEPLLRMITGCWAPYESPSFARCAEISDAAYE